MSSSLWKTLPQHKEKISPCRGSCPLENDIPRWMEQLKWGNWEKAWQIMMRYNPFPAITGYTCYHFCHSECNRGYWDEAVDIGELEKAVGIWRLKNDQISRSSDKNHEMLSKSIQGQSVAIVGSGPSGLSCAFYLSMLGADVTVFEKLLVAGGLLATGIPESRLPRDLLELELKALQKNGVVIETGAIVGENISRTYLDENFDAVILTVGAQESMPLSVTGKELLGVRGAIEFLRDFHLGKVKEVPGPVVIVGGGNAALDAATMACFLGVEEVSLIYRRSEEEMPAHFKEIKAAKEAGVQFYFQTDIVEAKGTETLELIDVSRTAPSKRGQDVLALPGTTFTLECRTLLVAVGQQHSLGQLDNFFCSTLEKDHIKSGRVWEYNNKFLLAAGDAVTGPSNVAASINSGRQAALKLLTLLRLPKKVLETQKQFVVAPPLFRMKETVSFESLNPYFYPHQGRNPAHDKEAARCFSCGMCNNCGVCWTFCPDLAVIETEERYEFLSEYCKNCSICVDQCPSNALEMFDKNAMVSQFQKLLGTNGVS